MKNQILLITVSVILCCIIGYAVPHSMDGHVSGLQIDRTLQKKNARSQLEKEMQRIVEADFEKRVNQQLREQIADGTQKLSNLTSETARKIDAEYSREAQRIYAESNSQDRAKTVVMKEVGSTQTTAAVVDSATKKQAMTKTAANRGQIDEQDQAEVEILSKSVDVDYLSALAEGGLTPEEDAQMQAYLHSRFTGEEYVRAKNLYYKYFYLTQQ